MHKTPWRAICTYAVGVHLISADSSAALLSLEPVAGQLHAHRRRRRCFALKRVGFGVFTWARQLFMNDLKLKMVAADARRKWLPREKVMPGKPGGDDGDAHAGDQSESSPLVRSSVRWSGTALPPMGVSRVWQRDRVRSSLGLRAAGDARSSPLNYVMLCLGYRFEALLLCFHIMLFHAFIPIHSLRGGFW